MNVIVSAHCRGDLGLSGQLKKKKKDYEKGVC